MYVRCKTVADMMGLVGYEMRKAGRNGYFDDDERLRYDHSDVHSDGDYSHRWDARGEVIVLHAGSWKVPPDNPFVAHADYGECCDISQGREPPIDYLGRTFAGDTDVSTQ